MTELRVLVCGGRTLGCVHRNPTAADLERAYAEQRMMDGTLIGAFNEGMRVLIHGDARGADRWCAVRGKDIGCSILAFPAAWDVHGRAAGAIRNARMLAEGKPDLVLAFPGGRGTADMVRRAERAGVPVRRIT